MTKESSNIIRNYKIKLFIELNLIEEDINNSKKLVIKIRGT